MTEGRGLVLDGVEAGYGETVVLEKISLAVEPGGTLALVQATGDAFGQVQVPPPAFTTAADTKVVFVGSASLNIPVLQLLGPALVMTWV